jgi:Asp-tRNA(Asn)/Glu-tRNA(Gln) amidotransferase A subunit family amidase
MAMVTAINAWDMRWPLNSYRNRDAGKMSKALLAQLAIAEAMTLEDYAALTLAATSAAPEGLGSTGNGIFGVPGSLLGVPAVSLPLLQAEQLPLGLQVVGFAQCDASLFATAAWLMEQLRDFCAREGGGQV